MVKSNPEDLYFELDESAPRFATPESKQPSFTYADPPTATKFAPLPPSKKAPTRDTGLLESWIVLSDDEETPPEKNGEEGKP